MNTWLSCLIEGMFINIISNSKFKFYFLSLFYAIYFRRCDTINLFSYQVERKKDDLPLVGWNNWQCFYERVHSNERLM